MTFIRALLLFAFTLTICLSLIRTQRPASHAAASTRQVAAAELPDITLSSPVAGLSQPVSIAHAGDGSGRLFVVEQGGRIRIIKNNAVLSVPFLDISNRLSVGGERGLLGLAFPPGYASGGHFYVNYTNAAGDTVIARYRRSNSNPDLADASSEQIILTIAQPFANHNGGQLAFSPRDGFLYIGMGDGGDAGDPGNRAQNTNLLLGKLLRLDVETGQPLTYTIPPSNPFINRAGFRPEIWALGMRNPWRFSFDRQTGDLYIADVGQGTWEEVNYQPAASAGGENYGWRIMEGAHCFNPSTCSSAGLTLPVWEYNHTLGCSATGGYVYRGSAFPQLQGFYFYADFCSGRIWSLRREAGVWQNAQVLDTTLGISTFGEDEAGNLYVADYSGGTIYTLSSPTPTPTPTPTPATPTTIAFGAAQYEVAEGAGSATVTITRTGASLNGTDAVDYAIADGTATQQSDYTFVTGHLVFGVGETSGIIAVPITADGWAEGDETATLSLANPSGAATLGTQSTTILLIRDDDATNAPSNPIDDPDHFVGQHYHDFLSRQSDAAGQNFWANQIIACAGESACVADRRQNVSAAFFLSVEFQTTGFFVYRFHKAAFGMNPHYTEFLADTQEIGRGIIVGQPGWQQLLESNRQAFVNRFLARAAFISRYPPGQTPAQYVDALNANAGGALSTAERDALVAGLSSGTETRATVLLRIAGDEDFSKAEFNPAFVLMQYFGYLRRNPDDAPDTNLDGYNFWLTKLNDFGGDFRRAEMVKAFLNSVEYWQRFGQP